MKTFGGRMSKEAGKGHKPRPMVIPRKKYYDNFDKIEWKTPTTGSKNESTPKVDNARS